MVFTTGSQSSAVLQGQGRSKEQASGFLVGQWGIAIPMCFLSFYYLHWGLPGLWAGLLAGFLVGSLVSVFFLVFKTDWEKIIQEGESRH